MNFMTELAIAEVVIRRLGARWFIGVLVTSFLLLYIMSSRHGPEMFTQLQANSENGFIFINICVLLLITVISATEIPYDISGRVLLVLLSKPIRRYQYITGKMLGIISVGLIYVLICSLFMLVCLVVFGYRPGALFFNAMGLSFLRVIASTGAAIFLSAAFTEVPTIAGCVAGGLFSAGISMFSLMLLQSDLPTYTKVILSPIVYAVPSLLTMSAPPTVFADMLHGRNIDYSSVKGVSFDSLFDSSHSSLPLSFVYAMTYAVIYLALAVMIFRKSEKVE